MNIEFAKADYGQEEIDAVNRVLKSDWLASGPENEAFEIEFADYVGAKYAVAVSSGSCANLIALASLRLPKGSKVLTSACGFPATLSPILHLGLEPVLIDYSLETFNADLTNLEEKLEGCDALILAHTLGNPLDVSRIMGMAEHFNVAIIEDCCEAIGTRLNGRHVGTFGDLGTYSFYPAHQMTALGGGGMVVTDDKELYETMKSMRDWGKSYDWNSDKGGVTTIYNSHISYHKGYTYDTVGWNFKLPEANCAFGREQILKLDTFATIRYHNWRFLRDGLIGIREIIIAPMLESASPFGFCMYVPNRNHLGNYLESCGIRHRPFFAGNILRQPAFLSSDSNKFPVADKLMANALFIGCHTKLTQDDLEYMVKTIRDYCNHP